jgi:hypothetical protein
MDEKGIKVVLRRHIDRNKWSVKEAADHWEVSRQHLYGILGIEGRPPTDKMLAELGYKRETVYTKVKEQQ